MIPEEEVEEETQGPHLHKQVTVIPLSICIDDTVTLPPPHRSSSCTLSCQSQRSCLNTNEEADATLDAAIVILLF